MGYFSEVLMPAGIYIRTQWRGTPLLTPQEKQIHIKESQVKSRLKKGMKPHEILTLQQKETRKKLYNKTYRDKNKKVINQKAKQFKLNHSDIVKSWSDTYYQKHSEEIILRSLQWQKENPDIWKPYQHTHNTSEEHKQKSKDYKQTPKGRTSQHISRAKRRDFGFIPLNEWFDGCEGHHVDKQHVIHIPKELHTSVSHSIIHNKNMEQINKLAYEFKDLTNL